VKAGCAFVLLVVALVLCGLGFLVILHSAARPRPEPSPEPSPTPLPDTYRGRVGSLNRFRRYETTDRYVVSYAFIDYLGRSHEVTCGVRREDYRREGASYGYVKEDVDVESKPALQRWTDQELGARRLRPYVTVDVKGAYSGYHWEWQLPGGMDDAERARRTKEIEGFLAWYDTAFNSHVQAARAASFQARGLHLENNVLSIDYPGLAERARAPLEDCSRALERAGPGYSRRQQLGLFLAFLQEIRYEIPPPVVNGRESFGLYVPTEVVVNDHGDCDSKSTTFAAMWLRLGTPVILISLPKHMLVGVEVKPGPREAFVRIGNRYFVLCEVAGPGKYHPGERSLSGSFEYMLLEPS
jgi:hypothetical protein